MRCQPPASRAMPRRVPPMASSTCSTEGAQRRKRVWPSGRMVAPKGRSCLYFIQGGIRCPLAAAEGWVRVGQHDRICFWWTHPHPGPLPEEEGGRRRVRVSSWHQHQGRERGKGEAEGGGPAVGPVFIRQARAAITHVGAAVH